MLVREPVRSSRILTNRIGCRFEAPKPRFEFDSIRRNSCGAVVSWSNGEIGITIYFSSRLIQPITLSCLLLRRNYNRSPGAIEHKVIVSLISIHSLGPVGGVGISALLIVGSMTWFTIMNRSMRQSDFHRMMPKLWHV